MESNLLPGFIPEPVPGPNSDIKPRPPAVLRSISWVDVNFVKQDKKKINVKGLCLVLFLLKTCECSESFFSVTLSRFSLSSPPVGRGTRRLGNVATGRRRWWCGACGSIVWPHRTRNPQYVFLIGGLFFRGLIGSVRRGTSTVPLSLSSPPPGSCGPTGRRPGARQAPLGTATGYRVPR